MRGLRGRKVRVVHGQRCGDRLRGVRCRCGCMSRSPVACAPVPPLRYHFPHLHPSRWCLHPHRDAISLLADACIKYKSQTGSTECIACPAGKSSSSVLPSSACDTCIHPCLFTALATSLIPVSAFIIICSIANTTKHVPLISKYHFSSDYTYKHVAFDYTCIRLCVSVCTSPSCYLYLHSLSSVM